jgi:hypothetical protein
MLTTIGQYVGGRVLTAILVVASAGAVIYFWRNPDNLAAIWGAVKYALVWLGIVLVLPWATFFVTPWVVSKESNFAAGLMLFGYALADVIVAFLLVGGVRGISFLGWCVLLLGFLSATVYNFIVCEYQATQLEGN